LGVTRKSHYVLGRVGWALRRAPSPLGFASNVIEMSNGVRRSARPTCLLRVIPLNNCQAGVQASLASLSFYLTVDRIIVTLALERSSIRSAGRGGGRVDLMITRVQRAAIVDQRSSDVRRIGQAALRVAVDEVAAVGRQRLAQGDVRAAVDLTTQSP